MQRYFYADGKRHDLDAVGDRVAIDARGAASTELRDVVRALPVASTLPSGMVIVERSAIAKGDYDRLSSAGLVQSVYRYGESLVVLMPEVRVELDQDQHGAALDAVKASRVRAQITDDTPERLSLRPESGKAEDALDLANFIYETARPAASSVRMIQVVPKRGVQK